MSVSVKNVWRSLERVMDPEVPVLNIVEMGIVRDVRVADEEIRVAITPTYSGCPAMKTIEDDIRTELEAKGMGPIRVNLVYAPAWTTDWMTEPAREKLREYGIAPPERTEKNPDRAPRDRGVACPFCGSNKTDLRSAFGSTACKALYFCDACRQPFEQFKCI